MNKIEEKILGFIKQKTKEKKDTRIKTNSILDLQIVLGYNEAMKDISEFIITELKKEIDK